MTRQTNSPLFHRNMEVSTRSVREMWSMVKIGEIDMSPPYQRGDVWTLDQRISLIRSWLEGNPTGSVVLSNRDQAEWRRCSGDVDLKGEPFLALVDGKQRVTTAAQWLGGDLSVPASWFDPSWVETTEGTTDGPYVRFPDLTAKGQRLFKSRAMFSVFEYKGASCVQDEADLYLLLNGGGTPQSVEDMSQAQKISKGM